MISYHTRNSGHQYGMYSISDTTELALRKSCRYRRRLVAWAWLSTRRRGWVDVLAPIALFPAQPPPACCSSGFRVPNHVGVMIMVFF